MTDANRLMTVFEAIAKRCTVRVYRPDRIDESTVRELPEVKAELGLPRGCRRCRANPRGVPKEEGTQTPRQAPEIICWRHEISTGGHSQP